MFYFYCYCILRFAAFCSEINDHGRRFDSCIHMLLVQVHVQSHLPQRGMHVKLAKVGALKNEHESGCIIFDFFRVHGVYLCVCVVFLLLLPWAVPEIKKMMMMMTTTMIM